ncbi:MAG: hypothetical protein LC774_10455 [Acidobacteria bacterium]|nr:hypothetical protein [Acidobacteriota bacterium]
MKRFQPWGSSWQTRRGAYHVITCGSAKAGAPPLTRVSHQTRGTKKFGAYWRAPSPGASRRPVRTTGAKNVAKSSA